MKVIEDYDGHFIFVEENSSMKTVEQLDAEIEDSLFALENKIILKKIELNELNDKSPLELLKHLEDKK